MYQILLALHITAGFTAFSTGILAMLAAKGKKGHNSSGIIFVFAMFTVAATAFAMSLMKLNLFLFMIAGFSMYMTFMGYRFLKIRRMKTPGVGKYDWMATLSGFLTLLVPTTIILFNFSNTHQGTLIVYTVFGAIMSIMIFQDIQVYRKISRQSKSDLLAIHVARMVGAFIAASTAFLVLNWQSDPIWIAWLLPTFIFSPVIAYHQRKVKKAKPGTRVA